MTDRAAETRSVVVEREIPYPPEKIWRALTQPHLIEEWLMKNDFEPVVGHRFNLAIMRAGGSALAVAGDIAREEVVQDLRAQAERVFGSVLLVAACVGGGGDPRPLVKESLERWRATLEVNLTSAFLTLRTFLPPMMEAGRGAIVTMSSSAGRQLSGASAPYAAAKAGQLALTRQAAVEAAPRGVRINAIAPSAIVTDRLAAAPLSVRDKIAESFPLRRVGEVSDVVEAALFLLGDRSSWITGATLDVAGGRVTM